MSYYTDATIADLPTVLELIRGGSKPDVMMARFVADVADADLLEVLLHLTADAGGNNKQGRARNDHGIGKILDRILDSNAQVDALAELWMRPVEIAEALQGIEDREQTTISVDTKSDGTILRVGTGGTVVEFP